MSEKENKIDELYHHGVIGMKWYQHIFGKEYAHAQYNKKSGKAKSKQIKSDTAAKIKRMKARAQYNSEVKKAKQISEDKINKAKEQIRSKYGFRTKSGQNKLQKVVESGKKIVEDKRKSPVTMKSLSDQDLQAKVNRLNLERNYMIAKMNYNDTMAQFKPAKVNKGRQIVGRMLKGAGSAIYRNASSALKPVISEYLQNLGRNMLGIEKQESLEETVNRLRLQQQKVQYEDYFKNKAAYDKLNVLKIKSDEAKYKNEMYKSKTSKARLDQEKIKLKNQKEKSNGSILSNIKAEKEKQDKEAFIEQFLKDTSREAKIEYNRQKGKTYIKGILKSGKKSLYKAARGSILR